MTFRVGQKVVCVNNSCGCYLSVDAVYTVSFVGVISASGNVPAICVVEDPHPHVKPGEGDWRASRFRPVVENKTDISIFTEMLKPKQRELISH